MSDYKITEKAAACLREAKAALSSLTREGQYFYDWGGPLSENNIKNGPDLAVTIVHDEVYKPCMDGQPTFTITPNVKTPKQSAR